MDEPRPTPRPDVPRRYLQAPPAAIRARYDVTAAGAIVGGLVGMMVGGLIGGEAGGGAGSVIPIPIFEVILGALIGYFPGMLIGTGVALTWNRDPLAVPTIRLLLLTTLAGVGLNVAILRLQARHPHTGVLLALGIPAVFLAPVLARFLALRLHDPRSGPRPPRSLPEPGTSVEERAGWGRVRVRSVVLPQGRFVQVWLAALISGILGAALGTALGTLMSLMPSKDGDDLPLVVGALAMGTAGSFLGSWLGVKRYLERLSDPLAEETVRALVLAYPVSILGALITYGVFVPDANGRVMLWLSVGAWVIAPLAARWWARRVHRRWLRASLAG